MTHPVAERNLATYAAPASVESYAAEVGLRPVEAAMIDEFFPAPPARVLDLGCGAGRTTVGLVRRGFTAVGIDLSRALLDVARSRFPGLEFVEMDATRLAYDERSFDAALFSYNGIDCIYPIEARRACLREVYRVLRPGGVFVLSSHNVVGAVFSGGYFYPRGYVNALRFAADQLGNPHAMRWFFRYRDAAAGDQFLYSAPPSWTIRDARAAGFDFVEIRSASGVRAHRHVAMHEKHVHFTLRKPVC